MEADVGAGPPASTIIQNKMTVSRGTGDSAECDAAGSGTAKALLEEVPPTEVELEDTMSKIHNFLAFEGAFSTIGEQRGNTIAFANTSSSCFLGKNRFTNASFVGKTVAASSSAGTFKTSAVAGSLPSLSRVEDSQPPPLPTLGQSVSAFQTKRKNGLTDAGGALGGVILGARSGETPAPAPPTPSAPPSTPVDLQQDVPCERDGYKHSQHQPRAEEHFAGELPAASPDQPAQASRNVGFGRSLPEHTKPSLQELLGGAEDTDGIPGIHAKPFSVPSASSPPQRPAAMSIPTSSPDPHASMSSSSPMSAGAPSLLSSGKMRLGITPTGTVDDRNMRYLHIHERGRDGFQQYAKALIGQLSVECAESNPYVKALCAHRQEMMESSLDLKDEVVTSLAARLATEREDNLATMTVSEEQVRPCGLGLSCEGGNKFDSDLYLPELEIRHQHSLHGNNRFLPSPQSPQASTDRSTTADTRSDPEKERPPTLRLRIGRNRLELSEADRSDFLCALGDSSRHLSVSMAKPGTCGGDMPLTSRVDLD